jgi:hypothetical protein
MDLSGPLMMNSSSAVVSITRRAAPLLWRAAAITTGMGNSAPKCRVWLHHFSLHVIIVRQNTVQFMTAGMPCKRYAM